MGGYISSHHSNFYEEGTRQCDAKHGTWKVYHKGTGNLVGMENYENGFLHGSFVKYDFNGNLIFETTYKKGFEVGPQVRMDCQKVQKITHLDVETKCD